MSGYLATVRYLAPVAIRYLTFSAVKLLSEQLAVEPHRFQAPRHGPSPGTHSVPHRRSRTHQAAACGRGPALGHAASRAQSQAARRHLHRRNHAGAHLLLLRRDAGRISLHRPEVRQRDAHQARRREARRLRVRGQRQAARQRIEPRAVALCRDVGGHQAGDRGKHRAHLQAELPEPGRADRDRLQPDRQGPPRRRDSADRVHRRARTRSRAR